MMKDANSNSMFSFKPSPRNGGLKLEDHWVWCGSVIKGDDGIISSYERKGNIHE